MSNSSFPFMVYNGCADKTPHSVRLTGRVGENSGIDRYGIPRIEMGFSFFSAFLLVDLGKIGKICCIFGEYDVQLGKGRNRCRKIG